MADVETSIPAPRREGPGRADSVVSTAEWRLARTPRSLLTVARANGQSSIGAVLTWMRGSSHSSTVTTAHGSTIDIVAAMHRRTPASVRNLLVAAVAFPLVAVMWGIFRSDDAPASALWALAVAWMAAVSVGARLAAGGRGDGYKLTDVRASVRGTGSGERALASLVGQREPVALTVEHDRLAQMYARIGFAGSEHDRDGRIEMHRPGEVRDGTQFRIDAAIACLAGALASVVIGSALADGAVAPAVSVVAIVWAVCIDVLAYRLPNVLLGVALVGAAIAIGDGALWRSVAAGAVAAIVLVVARVGAGDVKLAAVGGVLIGQPIAALVGVAGGLLLSLATARRRPRPLGPSLAVGFFAIMIGNLAR